MGRVVGGHDPDARVLPMFGHGRQGVAAQVVDKKM